MKPSLILRSLAHNFGGSTIYQASYPIVLDPRSPTQAQQFSSKVFLPWRLYLKILNSFILRNHNFLNGQVIFFSKINYIYIIIKK
jgi:hypothetical protein